MSSNINTNEIINKAQRIMPGGVNSPVRACKAVESKAFYTSKVKDQYIYDINNNKYIDYLCSWGANILGHNPIGLSDMLSEKVKNGLNFGTNSESEVILADLITQLVPSMEMVRMVNSGTEATMSSIRLARAYNNKNKIIKFAGSYHGHADLFLKEAGSGLLTNSIATSTGIPNSVLSDTLIAEYNNIDSIKDIIKNNKNEISALIIEPVAGNMGCVLPNENFLKEVEYLCKNNNIILIFDEVMTGFRIGINCAQGKYNIKPDITCLGKIVGGGLPIGVFGGSKEIMRNVAPIGNVYQAGTLSGNHIAMNTGIFTLNKLIKNKDQIYSKLESNGIFLEEGIKEISIKYKNSIIFNRIGSMFSVFFNSSLKKISTYEDVKKCNLNIFKQFYKYMLKNNVYIPPSQFEACFYSFKHEKIDISIYIDMLNSFLKQLN